jgi:cobalt-zinc-cadmium efflux system outer membrane protein
MKWNQETRMRIGIALVCVMGLGLGPTAASAQPDGPLYSLDMIVDLALSKNPVVSFAEGTIEQQKGQQTAAGAYPNPTVAGAGGHGNLQDTGRAGIGPFLDRQSVTEYNFVVGSLWNGLPCGLRGNG